MVQLHPYTGASRHWGPGGPGPPQNFPGDIIKISIGFSKQEKSNKSKMYPKVPGNKVGGHVTHVPIS